MSVSIKPESRLRHWCSSRYLHIPPLHREFRSPLLCSSIAVSRAVFRLSLKISPTTYYTAYAPFTPSNSEQRLLLPYYRGCWHGISRSFLYRYRQTWNLFESRQFFPANRGLRPEGLHPPRGVAASGFRPLRNIPHCCLPQESGPYLSPSVADHPLRPATHHRQYGRPLPYRQTNGPRAHSQAITEVIFVQKYMSINENMRY